MSNIFRTVLGIISLLAFFISVGNMTYFFYTRRVKIDLEIKSCCYIPIAKQFQVHTFICNQSQLPISIKSIFISSDIKSYYMSKLVKRRISRGLEANGKLNVTSEVYSFKFPINIPELSGVGGIIIFKTDKALIGEHKIIFSTNRGSKAISCEFPTSTPLKNWSSKF